MTERPEGARGFDDRFWRTNYAEPELMDGIANAGAHAAYLKASFDTVMGEVASVADFGFGKGHLFEAVLQAFQPYKALGIEPSPSVFEAVRFRDIAPERTKLHLDNVDLATWCARPEHPKLRADLGVCTSVLQYLSDEELHAVVPTLARRVKWLYLTVPTDEELDRMKADTGFEDGWAIRRSRQDYVAVLAPHWERVGARLLESRALVEPDRSPFTDALFRGW